MNASLFPPVIERFCNRRGYVHGHHYGQSLKKACKNFLNGDQTASQEELIIATTAAEILVDAIQDWGVEVVFGLPGDAIRIDGYFFKQLVGL